MKALITGGGGFLGSAITRMLIQSNIEVRNFSRHMYPWLAEIGVEQVQGDLIDGEAVERAVAGVDIVYHVAAKVGAWGAYSEFYATNVLGTKNIVSACRKLGIEHLVYTSSPSVVFQGKDLENADESVPYAKRFKAHYPRTKAIAEKIVLNSNTNGLRTIALRPHLIWGPNDKHLVSRILHRATSGGMRKIEGIPKKIDITYVDDAAQAHLLAGQEIRKNDQIGGNTYFISSGDPRNLSEIIDKLVEAAGAPPVTKKINPRNLSICAAALELLYNITRRKNEPPITRWIASELTTSHWFNISKAKRDLNYEPKISLEVGLKKMFG